MIYGAVYNEKIQEIADMLKSHNEFGCCYDLFKGKYRDEDIQKIWDFVGQNAYKEKEKDSKLLKAIRKLTHEEREAAFRIFKGEWANPKEKDEQVTVYGQALFYLQEGKKEHRITTHHDREGYGGIQEHNSCNKVVITGGSLTHNDYRIDEERICTCGADRQNEMFERSLKFITQQSNLVA